MSVHSSTNAMQIETGLEKTVENIRADSLVASEEIGSSFKTNDSSPTIEIDGIQETSEEETEAISERLITVKQTTEEIIKLVSTIENTEKTANFIGKLQNTVESVEQVTSEIKEKSDFCNILEIIPEEIISEETTIDNNTMDSYQVVANDVTLDTAPPKPIRRSSCNKGFESEIQQNLEETNKSSEVIEDIAEINLPTQPTPPPRRLSVVPSEISNSALGINSLSASSTTQNTSSNSRLTLPYRSSRGRLSFPTLPRNALPPTMGM
uniref:Uncharacterized protein n=1 Tax=Heterorhabditis bacteriophora TaxID=37862 RepID=A0A1I7XFU4_HETBA